MGSVPYRAAPQRISLPPLQRGHFRNVHGKMRPCISPEPLQPRQPVWRIRGLDRTDPA